MKKAIDVANFFISLYKDNPESDITNLKVNKLIYFAQGHYLAKYGEPLFQDAIEAWPYGPVVADVYQAFKSNKDSPIKKTKGNYSENDFTNEELYLLLDVEREYNQYSASTLVNLVHKKDTPWDVCKKTTKQTISNEDIKKYFLDKELKSFEFNYDKKNEIEKRRNGHLVLPEEYNNPEDDIYDKV